MDFKHMNQKRGDDITYKQVLFIGVILLLLILLDVNIGLFQPNVITFC